MDGLQILRHYGWNQSSILAVFLSVILAKLTYAAPVWIGFANRLRLAKVVKPTYRLHIGARVNAALLTYLLNQRDREILFPTKVYRLNFAPPDQKSFQDLLELHEESLFNAIVVWSNLGRKEDKLQYAEASPKFRYPERGSIFIRDINFILWWIHKNSLQHRLSTF